MEKVKVMITERNNLNENLITSDPDIILTNDPNEADFLISQSTVMFPQLMSKTIYLAIEPPRSSHRIWCYSNFDKFKHVFCHDPKLEKENQEAFQPDDACQFYPTRADPYPFVTREDTTMKNRGVFYAGNINNFGTDSRAHGGIDINPLRKVLGYYFLKNHPGTYCRGEGFPIVHKPANWREDKLSMIAQTDCDFVLAMENTIYPNYLYEKIWDGFASDRVTMYLGDPRVEHHIPLNCFIDLRPYFNKETGDFDCESLSKKLKEMTQEEYDTILKNARAFRITSEGKYRYYMDLLTKRIINLMKQWKSQSGNQ